MQSLIRMVAILAIVALVVPVSGCITGPQTTGSDIVLAVNRHEDVCNPETASNAVWKRCMDLVRTGETAKCRDQGHLERQTKTATQATIAVGGMAGGAAGCTICGYVAAVSAASLGQLFGGWGHKEESCPTPRGEYENLSRGGGYWD